MLGQEAQGRRDEGAERGAHILGVGAFRLVLLMTGSLPIRSVFEIEWADRSFGGALMG